MTHTCNAIDETEDLIEACARLAKEKQSPPQIILPVDEIVKYKVWRRCMYHMTVEPALQRELNWWFGFLNRKPT